MIGGKKRGNDVTASQARPIHERFIDRKLEQIKGKINFEDNLTELKASRFTVGIQIPTIYSGDLNTGHLITGLTVARISIQWGLEFRTQSEFGRWKVDRTMNGS